MSHRDRLLALIEREGPMSSSAVQKALDISRPTLSRLMRQTDGEILRLGQTRRVRYAAPRQLAGLPETIPVARVDADGRAHSHARIRPLQPGEWAWEGEEGELRIAPGLPAPVADLWPLGFMGRMLLSEQEAEDEAARLRTLMAVGEDLPGDLILGETALSRFLSMDPQPRSLDELPALARAVEAGERPGGLLGGDWPKFTAWLENHQVLVKFTRLSEEPLQARRADLLAAEAQALTLLGKAGANASPVRLLDMEGFRFLCLPRFDRVGRLGRRPVIRLAYLKGKGIDPADWSRSATALKRSARLEASEAEAIAWLDDFGALIANTDRGGDNLAFFLEEEEKLSLAPVFDMLPSAAAPTANGELPEALPELPLPSADALDRWRSAARLAAEFWSRLSNDKRVSFDFRKLAAAQGKKVSDRLERIGG